MNRTLRQNNLYHELCSQLKAHKVIKIYDGCFEEYGFINPVVFNPAPFGYDTFRELLKACDLSYPRCERRLPLSSSKITSEQMNSHILFLECLLAEY